MTLRPHDDDLLAPGDPLAAHLAAFRAEAPVREDAVHALKEAVRGDARVTAAARVTPIDAAPSAPRRAAAREGALRWLVAPRRIALSPLGAAATLAAVALGGALVARITTPRADAPRTAATIAAAPMRAAPAVAAMHDGTPRVVRFTLKAPDARRVTLVGDFNGWDARATPLARRGEEWTIVIPVAPGRHLYGFVVDDATWIADPAAPRVESEFGAPNSVLVVGT